MSNNPKQPLIIAEQGSFAIGGSTLKHDGVFRTDHFLEPEGQIAYGDHAYAFYQVPVDASAARIDHFSARRRSVQTDMGNDA